MRTTSRPRKRLETAAGPWPRMVSTIACSPGSSPVGGRLPTPGTCSLPSSALIQSLGFHPGPRAFGNSLQAHHGVGEGAPGAQPPPLTVTREAPPSSLTPIISSWPFPCPVAVSPSVPLHEGPA